ncbi:MDR family MFS transporter [Streptomyces sp. TP-A0874]|uniref:MDR family MFS transporter n=1 Tax=Streptomyces sp. TP-A0874 TaxID=549819 RepID=UPI0009A0418C|nr:MDR family MFS transporter [Streptomyces sp. TP-A0874]
MNATANQTEAGSPLRLTPREILVTMSGLVIAMLLAMMDNMIVAPALPTIVGDLGGLNHLAWVATGYILATTVATPLWGKLGDLFGRRATFLSAVAIFLVGSALCGMSQDMTQLIGFRALQGVGAGGLMVGVIAIIGDIIPPRERGKYQGVMMAAMPVAMIGGPLAGGFITDHLSWRWAFYVNLPLGVVTLLVCWFTLRKLPRGTGKATIDWGGAALLSVWITALVLVTSWGGSEYEWSSPQILGLSAVAAVGLAAFILTQQRVKEPIMPLSVFGHRNFTLAGVLSFITGFAMFGGVTFLPQFQQFVQGSSATNSGLLLMPMMIASMVVSLAGGLIISKTGHYRPLLIVGSVLITAGLGLMATMGLDTTKGTTSLYMVLLGAGMGCMMQTTMLIAQNDVPMRDLGAATGAATFLRSMGGSLGVSILGAIYSRTLLDKMDSAGAAGPAGQTRSATEMTPEALRQLPDGLRRLFQEGVTSGIGSLFAAAAAVAAVGIAVSFFIRHVPLRGFGSAQPAEAGGPEGATPAEAAVPAEGTPTAEDVGKGTARQAGVTG